MVWSIPFLGRLRPLEYLALLVSFILIGLEGFIRIVTLALPTPIINVFYRSSRRLFNYLSSPKSKRKRNTNKKIVQTIAHANDFVELCEIFGYYAEEHIVQTKDGYLLGLHRLGWKKGEVYTPVNAGEGSLKKKVVYLHHGLMMNSEIWVCLTEEQRCLPFMLVEKGYDVWLGNNRGNKYSKKATNLLPTDPKFWEFSIDQFAFHDIPDSIDYILSTTNQPSLSYIGFSQGTAQAFAALAIHPILNTKVNLFIALAPAMSPPGLTSGIVDSFVKSSPEVLFLAFGRRALLTSATMWQALLYPPIFVRLIDMSLSFLFGWKTSNIPANQKLAAYPHLYSFTSTKTVVHWFQIIRNGKFQMYDDEYQAPWSVSDGARFYKVARFPTRNIKTPIYLVYGGSDSLVDIGIMRKELPKHMVAACIPHYEHLDFLWAEDVDKQVFPHVFGALEKWAGMGDGGLEGPGKKAILDTEDEDLEGAWRKHSQSVKMGEGQIDGSTREESSKADAWWSSDEVGNTPATEPSTPVTKGPGSPSLRSPTQQVKEEARRDSPESLRKSLSRTSLESLIPKAKGIALGKAAGSVGVVTGSSNAVIASGSDGEGRRKRKKK